MGEKSYYPGLFFALKINDLGVHILFLSELGSHCENYEQTIVNGVKNNISKWCSR